MLKCEKCNVDLDIIDDKCPLCNSVIEKDKKFDASYPVIKPVVSNKTFRKLLFFVASVISLLVTFRSFAI